MLHKPEMQIMHPSPAGDGKRGYNHMHAERVCSVSKAPCYLDYTKILILMHTFATHVRGDGMFDQFAPQRHKLKIIMRSAMQIIIIGINLELSHFAGGVATAKIMLMAFGNCARRTL